MTTIEHTKIRHLFAQVNTYLRDGYVLRELSVVYKAPWDKRYMAVLESPHEAVRCDIIAGPIQEQ